MAVYRLVEKKVEAGTTFLRALWLEKPSSGQVKNALRRSKFTASKEALCALSYGGVVHAEGAGKVFWIEEVE